MTAELNFNILELIPRLIEVSSADDIHSGLDLKKWIGNSFLEESTKDE